MVDQADQQQKELTEDYIAAFKAAMPALADLAAPPNLPASATDEELIFNLRQAGGGVASYGMGSWIKDAVTALADRARNTVSTGIANAALDDLNPLVGRFLGDIFVYLKAGDVRNKIRACIRQPMISFMHMPTPKAANEPLILVGHSLGGVILYDMLSSPQSAGLPGDLDVAALVTVGSQPGLFEEMGLFESASRAPVARPVPVASRSGSISSIRSTYSASGQSRCSPSPTTTPSIGDRPAVRPYYLFQASAVLCADACSPARHWPGVRTVDDQDL